MKTRFAIKGSKKDRLRLSIIMYIAVKHNLSISIYKKRTLFCACFRPKFHIMYFTATTLKKQQQSAPF